ncbi:BnaCnng23790D [Brassica napus]|uniref:BnaCnng23790D protein n=2 Tax=Brassica TaxID=3705 RepID=A0A078IPD5_BRANA|nr:BnaCnng23790D [Brassica napus]
MYNELVAKSASCFEKMRKSIVLELNQVSGILSADRATLADSDDDDDEHEI